MFARLVRNPLLIGAGAGAALILGSASAVFAQVDPTPSVSASATDTASSPPPPTLTVTLKSTTTTAIHAGTDVPMTAVVAASGGDADDVLLGVTADNGAGVTARCVTPAPADPHCKLGKILDGKNETVELHVTVSKGMPVGTVTVNAEATSGDVKGDATPFPLKVTETTKPDPNGGSGGTTGGGGKTPTGGHKTTGGSKTGGSKTGGSGSGTTGGSTGGVPSPMATLSPPSDTSVVTPPSTAPSPGAVLPSIPAQPPTTSPVLTAGNSQSMRTKAEGPDELTFNKLASTQAAWLAALLVAFSLLLTQVRLGKAANRANRLAGVHRRLRRRKRHPRSH